MQHRIRTTANIQHRAKELRQAETPAEKMLWARLRNRQLGGFKFRRQHPLGPFIADFYCAECRLVVELDGSIHDSQKAEDEQRTRQFEEFNYRVIRFSNEEILSNIESALQKILAACQIPLSPNGERGARRAG